MNTTQKIPAPLKRQKVTFVDTVIDEGLITLNQKTQSLFKYTALDREIQKTKTGHAVSLKKAMAELNIEPFDPKTVEKYKARQVRKASASFWGTARTVSMPSFFINGFISALGLFGVFVAAGFCATLPPLFVTAGLTISFVLFVVSFIILGITDNMTFQEAYWSCNKLAWYDNKIPEFALQTAVDLKEKCPSAEFYIDELQLRDVKINDPFLVVRDQAGNEYYLEVWNEPEFTKVRS